MACDTLPPIEGSIQRKVDSTLTPSEKDTSSQSEGHGTGAAGASRRQFRYRRNSKLKCGRIASSEVTQKSCGVAQDLGIWRQGDVAHQISFQREKEHPILPPMVRML
jgi:hypothetical protein